MSMNEYLGHYREVPKCERQTTMTIYEKAKEELADPASRTLTPHGQFYFDTLTALVATTEALEEIERSVKQPARQDFAGLVLFIRQKSRTALALAHKEVA